MPLVLYLTTDCNLNCEYCYEATNRKKLNHSIKLDIDTAFSQMDEAMKSSDCLSNCIVLFGGEPFLEYDTMKKIFDYNIEKCNNYFCFSINTNSLLLTDDIMLELREYMNKTGISLVVSYDGIGTYRRTHYDGTSAKKEIEAKIDRLEQLNVPFEISYTIHKGNYQYKGIIRDVVFLFEKYKLLNKICFSYYTDELDEIVGINNVHEYIYDLMKKMASVYKVYQKPICCSKLNVENKFTVISPVCSLCRRCSVDDKRIYVSDDKITIKEKNESDGKFDQWPIE